MIMSKMKEEMVKVEGTVANYAMKEWNESGPYFSDEQMRDFCDSIMENMDKTDEGFAMISYNYHSFPKNQHTLTGESVTMIHRFMADDPAWVLPNKDKPLDAWVYIGKKELKDDFITCAFYECTLEETGEAHISELQTLYKVAIANDCEINKEGYDSANDYAVITRFVNNELLDLVIPKGSLHIEAVRKFISNTVEIINAYPSPTKEKHIKNDVLSKDVFETLISEITNEVKDDTQPKKSEE
jgi:hypothetical protein